MLDFWIVDPALLFPYAEIGSKYPSGTTEKTSTEEKTDSSQPLAFGPKSFFLEPSPRETNLLLDYFRVLNAPGGDINSTAVLLRDLSIDDTEQFDWIAESLSAPIPDGPDFESQKNQLVEHFRTARSGHYVFPEMDKAVALASQMVHLPEYMERLALTDSQLTDLATRLQSAIIAALARPRYEQTVTCSTPRPHFGEYTDVEALKAQRINVLALQLEIRTLKRNAVERFERLVQEAFDAALPTDENDPSVQPRELSTLMYLVAREMEMDDEAENAVLYYNEASRLALEMQRDVAQSQAFRLESLRVQASIVATNDPEQIVENILPEIQSIRDNIPVIFALASADDSYDLAPYNQLNATALRNEYFAIFSYLSNPESDETDQMVTRRAELEAEFLAEAQSLATGRQTREEVAGLLELFDVQVNLWTQKNGIIEAELRNEGPEDARRCYDELVSSLNVFRRLAQPFLEPKNRDDHIFETMAQIEYKVYLDGQRSLDRPADGLAALSDQVLQNYSGSEGLVAQLETLKAEADRMGVGELLFSRDQQTGQLILQKDIDTSDTSQGQAAAQLTRSAYMMPGGWRGFLVPLAGAGAGYSLGAFGLPAIGLSTTPPGWVISGLTVAGAGIALGMDYYYDSRIRGAEPYAQVAKTGLSRIDADEASNNENGYYLYGGIILATSAAAPMSKPVAGALGGTSIVTYSTLKGLAQVPKAAATAILKLGPTKALQAGGRATMQQVALHARLAGQGVKAMSWPTRVALASGGGLYGTDYAFIDEDYNPVLWDGEVDTYYGAAGEALLEAELLYLLHRATWKYGTTTIGGKTYTGFGTAVQNAPYHWPAGIMRAGALGMMVDNELVNMNGEWSLVDPNLPRETLGERLAHDKQYRIDTPLGYAGIGAFFVPWGASVYRNFPIYLGDAVVENARVATWARGRAAVGAGLLTADVIPDQELDQWYLGGLGGALLANEAIAVGLNVDAGGSLVSTGIRVVWEWLNQYVQDQPLQAPDAKRLLWASTESNCMRFFSKGFMYGERGKGGFNNFPLGQRIVSARQWMRNSGSPVLHGLTEFKSLQGFAGNPLLMPGVRAFKAREVTPKGKPISLKYDSKGNEVPADQRSRLRVMEKNIHGNGAVIEVDGKQYRLTPRKGKDGSVEADDIVEMDGTTALPIKLHLQVNGLFAHDGRLLRMEAQRLGSYRFGGTTYTESYLRELKERNPSSYAKIKTRLRVEEGVHIEEDSGRLYQRRIPDPDYPTVLTSHNSGNPEKIKRADLKQVPIDFGKGRTVWLRLQRQRAYLDQVRLGGTKVPLYRGNVDKPNVAWGGIAYNVVVVPMTAYELNKHIFANTMYGDPEYQGMTRWTHYALCEALVHPFVMWPLGFDNALAQFVGRTLLTPGVIAEAKLFPSYVDSFPGVKLYNRRLLGQADNETGNWFADTAVTSAQGISEATRFWEWDDRMENDETPLDLLSDALTSAQPMPLYGHWGRTTDSQGYQVTYQEPDAHATYRRQEQCLREVFYEGQSYNEAPDCVKLHPKTLEAIKKEEAHLRVLASQLPTDQTSNDIVLLSDDQMEEIQALEEEEWAAREEYLKSMRKIERERVNALTDNVRDWIEFERKAVVDNTAANPHLNSLRRRTLVLMAAHIKQQLRDAREVERKDPSRGHDLMRLYEPYQQLEKDFPSLFGEGEDVIPVLDTQEKWVAYIQQVNEGRAEALDFGLGLHKQ